jgi:hypothetical protein
VVRRGYRSDRARLIYRDLHVRLALPSVANSPPSVLRKLDTSTPFTLLPKP